MLMLKLWHNVIWPAMLCVGMHVPQCSRTTCLLLGPSHWSCRAHTLSFTATLHSCSTAWLKQQLPETFLLTTNAEKTLEGFIYLEQTAVLKKPQTGYQQKQTKGLWLVDILQKKTGSGATYSTGYLDPDIVDNMHVETAQKVPSKPQDSIYTEYKMYIIPEPLARAILKNLHVWPTLMWYAKAM